MLAGRDRTVLPDGPETLRTALRGLQLAGELRLPFVSVIDTPGGELSPAAEEGGAAREIARCLAALITLPTPTVAILGGRASAPPT